jgi:hypothetical protein
MLFHELFNLPKDDQHVVDPAWFEGQKQRRVHKNDPSLRDWLANEVDAFKAFHDGHTNADEAALTMTRPISTSPVPERGGYSDEILGVCDLWGVIIAALIEWPSARTPDIFALLDAITKVSGKPHKGEASDNDGGKLTWEGFPYFGFAWHEKTDSDLQPGQICRQYSDSTLLASARRLYLKMKDIEAQLVAKHVLEMNKSKIQYIIRALEKKIDHSDEQHDPDEADGYTQVRLDFHIPAISFMFKYNACEIYDQVVQNELRDWTQRQMPIGAREFESGAERWLFWRRRLAELAQGDADDQVKVAAQASLEFMSLAV